MVLDEDVLPRFSIPRQFRAGIFLLAALQDDDYASLFAVVKSGVSADTPENAADRFKTALPSLSGKDLKDLVVAVASLQTVYESSHSPSTSFASDITEALASDAPDLAGKINGKHGAVDLPMPYKIQTDIMQPPQREHRCCTCIDQCHSQS